MGTVFSWSRLSGLKLGAAAILAASTSWLPADPGVAPKVAPKEGESAKVLKTLAGGEASVAGNALFGFDQVWRYDSSALTGNRGTAWREPGYDDASWPQGQGLLGFETTPAVYPVPILTPFSNLSSRVTFYFRTRFQFDAEPAGTLIIASNYIDDGAVFYLNGSEAGRLRMPAGAIDFGTFATANSIEGVLEPIVFPGGSLVRGENVLAVEVHQASVVSSDVILGAALYAFTSNSPPPPPAHRLPVITAQPQSLTVTSGQPAIFLVAAVDATNVPPVYRAAGPDADRLVYETGTPQGTLILDFNFYTLPDQVQVIHDGVQIYDSGPTNGAGTMFIPFGPGLATTLEIVMNGTNGQFGTVWEYTASILRPPLMYQWRRNGAALPGARNDTFVLAAAQPADAGVYSVVVANASGSVVSTGATLTVTAVSTNCVPAPADLAAWWPLNGNAADVQQGGDLILTGRAAFGAGQVAQALQFDGVTDYAIALASPTLDVGAGPGMSVELWIKPDDVSAFRPLLEWSDSGTVGVTLALSVDNSIPGDGVGSLHAGLRDLSGLTHPIRTAAGILRTGVWQHVALTYDRTAGVGRLFVNGSVVGQEFIGAFQLQTAPTVRLGQRLNAPFSGTLFKGAMDEVSLYRRALSPAQVRSIHAAGRFGKCSSRLPPFIVDQPRSATVVVGDAVRFSVTASGEEPLGYQWLFNHAALSGETNRSLELGSVRLEDAGTYAVLVSNAGGAVSSEDATLTVLASPLCTGAPPGLVSWWSLNGDFSDLIGLNTLTPGGVVSFSAGRVGEALLFDGVNDVAVAAATPALNVGPGAGLTVEGWIRPLDLTQPRPVLEWNNNAGSRGVKLWVSMGAPGELFADLSSGVSHPIHTPAGLLSVGDWQHVALTYDRSSGLARLYHNGALAAQTNVGSFTLQTSYPLYFGASPGGPSHFSGGQDEISIYDRALTAAQVGAIHAAGSGGKCKDALPPFIVSQPQNQTVIEGSLVTFNVVATGTAPVTYHWRREGVTLSVSTTSAFIIPNAASGESGSYSVVVSNLFGIAISSNAVLTVEPPHVPPQISSIAPISQTVPVGTDASINVTATGSAPLSYQWYRNGIALPGRTNAKIIFSPVQAADSGTYICIVTNLYGGTSRGSTLTVLSPPAIVFITPADQALLAGSNAVIAVAATGSAPLYYQWTRDGTALPGRTGSTISFTPAQTNDSGTYRCVVTNAVGSALSGPSVLNVTNSTAPPLSAAELFVLTATPVIGVDFIGSATGAQPLSYQWYFNGPTQPLSGGRSNVLSLIDVQPAQAGTYTYVVSNPFGSATNAGFVLNVLLAGPGGLIGFTNRAFPGVNGRVFDLSGTNPVPAGSAILAQLDGGLTADTLQPLGGTSGFWAPGRFAGGPRRVPGSVPGQTVFARVRCWAAASGASYNQALEAGGPIGRSAIFPVRLSDSATVPVPLDEMQSFSLVPGLAPELDTQPQSLTITQGMDATFSVTAGGSGPRHFQWHKAGIPIPGATAPQLTLHQAQPDQSGAYSVRVTNAFGFADSAEALLTVVSTNRPPEAVSAESVFVLEDTPLSLTLGASDPNGDVLSFDVRVPAHGQLNGTPPHLTYVPNANYHGPDRFTFTVSDGQLTSPEAIVSFIVLPVNDLPMAESQSVTVQEDSSVSIRLEASDVDGDELAFTITPPAHGALSGMAPNLAYHPAAHYFGPDSFTFTVSDGRLESASATIHITVLPVNDPPVPVITVSPLTVLDRNRTNWIILSANGTNAAVTLDGSLTSDIENDPLSVFWFEPPSVLAFGAGARFTNVFPTGVHSVTVLVDDGMSSSTGEATFEVLPPGGAVEELILLLDQANMPRKAMRPLLATLKASVASFDRGQFQSGANQLRAFLNKVRAQVAPGDPVLAAQLTAACQAILDAIH